MKENQVISFHKKFYKKILDPIKEIINNFKETNFLKRLSSKNFYTFISGIYKTSADSSIETIFMSPQIKTLEELFITLKDELYLTSNLIVLWASHPSLIIKTIYLLCLERNQKPFEKALEFLIVVTFILTKNKDIVNFNEKVQISDKPHETFGWLIRIFLEYL